MIEMIKIVFEARGAVLFFRTSPGVSTLEIAKAFTFECNHLRPFGNIYISWCLVLTFSELLCW
jgi:hypothetical protein